MRFEFISGLRGIAILSVLYHHLFYRFTSPGYGAVSLGGFDLLPLSFLSNGWMGVNLFFALSGFVLAYPYFSGRRSMDTVSDAKQFYCRRCKRLFPLYFFSVVVCMIWISPFVNSEHPWKDLFLMSTFTYIFTIEMFGPSYNWILWSLAIEVWFSAVFPFLLLGIRKWGMLKSVLGVFVVALLVRVWGNSEAFSYMGNPYINPVKDSFIGRLDDFMVGILCAWLGVRNGARFISSRNAMAFLGLSVILFWIVAMLWDYVLLEQLTLAWRPYLSLIVNVSIFLAIMSLYRMENPIRKYIFESRILTWPGAMSYSLYIWHGVTIAWIVQGQWTFERVSIYLFLIAALSTLSYRYIEFGSVKTWRILFFPPDRDGKEK